MAVVVAVVVPAGGFIFYFFVFDGSGWQRLAVGVGLQRKWWVFRETERPRERNRELKKKKTIFK